MPIGHTMTETITRAVTAVHAAEPVAAADPLRPAFHIGLAPGKSGVPADIAGCWTDMFVFREAGRTFAIFKEAGGLVVEAQNPEPTRWQAVGRIDGVFGECPNFLKLQDRWLLLRSTCSTTSRSWSCSSTTACRLSPAWPFRHRLLCTLKWPRTVERQRCGD